VLKSNNLQKSKFNMEIRNSSIFFIPLRGFKVAILLQLGKCSTTNVTSSSINIAEEQFYPNFTAINIYRGSAPAKNNFLVK